MSGRAPTDHLEWARVRDGGFPSPWGQAFPRSVRLAPDGFLVPSGTLRVLLQKQGRLEILYTGFALGPWIRDAGKVLLDSTPSPRPGDLALCEIGGWGDLRRILLTWARHGLWPSGCEFGDWFTWFLRPDGSIGKSFTHLFTESQVVAEARTAGFLSCRRRGAYFVATDFGSDHQVAFSSSAR